MIQAFDWKSLPNNAVVVDVGGGVGTMSMILARNRSHLQIVVQDRQIVTDDAIKVRARVVVFQLNSYSTLLCRSGIRNCQNPFPQVESNLKVRYIPSHIAFLL